MAESNRETTLGKEAIDMNYRKLTAIAVCVLIVLCLFTACGTKDQKAADDSLQKILDAGELVLGLDAACGSFEFIV